MRKVVLFLLFFGAGLTVLLFLRVQREAERATSPAPSEKPIRPGQMTELQTKGGAPGSKQVAVILHGAFDGTKFSGEGDTRKRLYVMHADDTEPLGDNVYDLHRVTVDIYRPETDALRAHIASPVSRVRVTIRNGQLDVGDDDRVYLTDADVTLHEGAPVVPLELHVPLLEWQVGAGRFTSKDRVQMHGTGFEAEGTGLDLDTQTSTLRLERDGIVDVALAKGAGATLAATGAGPIVVHKIDDPLKPEVDVLATDGASLAFSGAQKIVTNASTIHLRGRSTVAPTASGTPTPSTPGGTKELELTIAEAEGDVVADGPNERVKADRATFALAAGNRLDTAEFTGNVAMRRADESFSSDAAQFSFGPDGAITRAALQGHVELTRGGDHYRSRTALFHFGQNGALAHAELTGEPTGDLRIADYLTRTPTGSGARELRNARALIHGVGPLSLQLGEGMKLDMPGPGAIEIPELQFTLEAQRSLRGDVDAKRENARFFADGSAHAHYQESDVYSDAFEMRRSFGATGEEIVDLFTDGWTTLYAVTPDRGKITLEAIDGLEAESRLGRLTVPIARGVTIDDPGPKGFHARADVMRDVDWTAESFLAQGHVVYEDAQGIGTAETAIGRGRDDLALFGGESGPAHYRVRRMAPGDRGEIADIEGREIHRRGSVVESIGDVKGVVEAANERYHIDSRRMTVELADPRELAARAERPFHLVAEDQVHARLARGGVDSNVDCDRLLVDGVLQAPARGVGTTEIVSSSVRAQGDVKLDYHAAGGWKGDGDLLTLDAQHHGRLSAGAGRRVHALWNGIRGGAPYALEADWIDFDREHVDAAQALIREPTSTPPADVRGAATKPPAEPHDGTSDASASTRNATADAAGTTQSTSGAATTQSSATAPATQAAATGDTTTKPSATAGATATPQGVAGEASVAPQGANGVRLIEMRADHIHADEQQLVLSGRAHARGLTAQNETWTVDAGSIRAHGAFAGKPKLSVHDVDSIEAWEGFQAVLGARVRAEGERLFSDMRRVRMEGSLAKLTLPVCECRSDWIEYELATMLFSTGKGELRPAPGGTQSEWLLTYDSLRPREEVDNTIMAVRNPLLRSGDVEAHADWLLLWIDRDEWQQNRERALQGRKARHELRLTAPEPPPPPARKKNETLAEKFARRRAQPQLRVLSEAYLEGNVELLQSGERRARASSVYFDLREARGWAQDADLYVDVFIANQHQRVRAMAEWMRISTDLVLRADKAAITSCNFGQPHYVVETSNLEIRPGELKAGVGWYVAARGNWLRAEGGPPIPLPPIVYAANKNGTPLIESIVLGQSARFGTSVRAAFNLDLGPVGLGLGKLFGKIFSLPETDLDGHWKFDAGFLGSRGFLLGAGVVYDVKDKFHLDMEVSGIPDTHDDSGLVRVPTDERNVLRDWFRLRGRYNFDKQEWIDFVMSKQSDPGVQSEFYEHDYLNYEQKDNYLHWRKADDQYYFDASAKVLLEDRTDTAELPKLGAFRGRSPIGEIGSLPVLYDAYADFAYLHREDGNPEFYLPFPDGLGDRQVARFDTQHRLEAPFALGYAGIRATPWVAARGTVWDRGVDDGSTPLRGGLLGGLDFSTTFWKSFQSGFMNTISPTLSFHGDIASTQTGDTPIEFDQVEQPITGRFIDLDLRTRVWKPTSQAHFDLDVNTSYGSDTAPGQPEGVQPVAVNGEMMTYVGKFPVALAYDWRYDVQDGHANYTAANWGFEPHPKLDIEIGYHQGRDVMLPQELLPVTFQAVSVAARYRFTPKWELELLQYIALDSTTGVAHDFIIRRIAHDFVLDVGVLYREGEGASFGVRFTPRLSWKRSGIGLMDAYLGVNR